MQKKTSLSSGQGEGLKGVTKKVKDGDNMVLETDKTGKFAIVSKEKFLQMGAKHTVGISSSTRVS